MDREQHYLLNYLDQPMRLLFLTIDEFLILLVPLLTGFWFMHAFTGLASAVGGYIGLRLFKRQVGRETMRNGLYWHLPTSRTHMRLLIPSWIREYIA